MKPSRDNWLMMTARMRLGGVDRDGKLVLAQNLSAVHRAGHKHPHREIGFRSSVASFTPPVRPGPVSTRAARGALIQIRDPRRLCLF